MIFCNVFVLFCRPGGNLCFHSGILVNVALFVVIVEVVEGVDVFTPKVDSRIVLLVIKADEELVVDVAAVDDG